MHLGRKRRRGGPTILIERPQPSVSTGIGGICGDMIHRLPPRNTQRGTAPEAGWSAFVGV
jgi:hypothetical protein